MKIKLLITLALLSITHVFAGTPVKTYEQRSWSADNGNGTYTNPLFYDEFSDPDIIRVGNDYYLAGTTMHTVPGIVILHSTDLVNWKFASYCFDEFDDLSSEFRLQNGKDIYGQGIWAPCIRYHKGKFYVFSNINGHGLQAYIADNIKGPWKHVKVEGDIYDLSVLFDDNGKIYAIHKYGNVTCTELKPDLSGPVEGTSRVIIKEGNAMGEGHHVYKINGMYYIISADYSPMGRMQCARSKSIYGPYETCVISARESFGYGTAWTTGNVGLGGKIPEDGYKFTQNRANIDKLGPATIHQGGIVQAADGSWWGVSMQDFNAVGRTTCLSPVTWVDGWPYFGLEKNLGRSPRTWFKPNNSNPTPNAPYERCDDFNGDKLKPVWQWNHNPVKGKWALDKKKGVLRLHSMPANQFMKAKNTLTQRAMGPISMATVTLDASHLKKGDNAGLGILNAPYVTLGVVKGDKRLSMRWYDQNTNNEIVENVDAKKIWLRVWGDYDKSQVRFSYSTDGDNWKMIGDTTIVSYQMRTFQGARYALYSFNTAMVNGGYADFDNFIVDEPLADRSKNIPLGKSITINNIASGNLMYAMPHGMMHDAAPFSKNAKSNQAKFTVIDKGNGKINLKCADGRFVMITGQGLSGDVRFTDDANKAEDFVWQDMLNGEFMLLSMTTQKYVYKHPVDGSPYAADCQGPDANRKNGCVFTWQVAE